MSDRKKYMRAGIYRGIQDGAAGVDRKGKVIRGFAVMSKGNVKDMRGWEIDNTTLEQIVEAGNAYKMGLKCRFGHPNMSGSALGTFLGRIKNFRVEGDVARADLFFSDSAFRTPDGDLAGYVMDLAEQDPDAFGTSVVLRDFELEARLDENGEPEKDEKGEELPPLLRVKGLSAVDAVDDPAANDGMFGQKFFSESVIPSAVMTQFLNKLVEDPDAVDTIMSFLSRYQANRSEVEEEVEEEPQTRPDEGEKEAEMSIKEITLDQVKTDRTDIADALRTEGAESVDLGKAQTEAVAKERTRATAVLGLLENEAYAKFFSIALDGIKDGSSLEVVEGKMKDQRIADLEESSEETPGPGEETEGEEGEANGEGEGEDTEEKAKAKFEKDADLQKEFGKFSTYHAYLKNKGRVKIFSGRKSE
jgi:hypothetical protein